MSEVDQLRLRLRETRAKWLQQQKQQLQVESSDGVNVQSKVKIPQDPHTNILIERDIVEMKEHPQYGRKHERSEQEKRVFESESSLRHQRDQEKENMSRNTMQEAGLKLKTVSPNFTTPDQSHWRSNRMSSNKVSVSWVLPQTSPEAATESFTFQSGLSHPMRLSPTAINRPQTEVWSDARRVIPQSSFSNPAFGLSEVDVDTNVHDLIELESKISKESSQRNDSHPQNLEVAHEIVKIPHEERKDSIPSSEAERPSGQSDFDVSEILDFASLFRKSERHIQEEPSKMNVQEHTPRVMEDILLKPANAPSTTGKAHLATFSPQTVESLIAWEEKKKQKLEAKRLEVWKQEISMSSQSASKKRSKSVSPRQNEIPVYERLHHLHQVAEARRHEEMIRREAEQRAKAVHSQASPESSAVFDRLYEDSVRKERRKDEVKRWREYMQQNRIDPDTGDHLFEPKVNARASPEGVRGENIGEHLYQEYYEMEQRREELRRAEAQKIEDERERVKMNPNSAKILEKRSVSPAVPRPQEIRPEPKFRPKINEKSNELDPYKAKNVDRALLLYQKVVISKLFCPVIKGAFHYFTRKMWRKEKSNIFEAFL
eukprot:TRINITY_DN2864_c0_g1_i7.p1 TRINITY_DN2864_c0_g1~~TRINITY_DN2864_c0_g1_i7.p1  ORF type:complete len:601 (-),score=120.68 TRINITY_DN2864_c0_g1_i7:161-1963(-)